ncbi:MarR family transcriptional regulator [Eubacterium oxidoreducens]|uniref:DNA-binding transcriptional regulator, MarR family n=1 Tax=Eubacterium oxidoreducens TaxID=1732 RepID=A0A1G6ADX2_EUBOX|nr:MarR family transcriptional regulator [Eubacterium oxidoreducens]SDB06510.1 DNA-binding transcriptional regulator, MarR family [Eubacterium oxidoreducens]
MKPDTLKTFIDACTYARKILSFLPALPKDITPRHIRILGTIHELQQTNSLVKVSDVADVMHATRPSITRLINELESLKLVDKKQSTSDKRIITLQLTKKGHEYQKLYIEDYYKEMSDILSAYTDEDILKTSKLLNDVYDTLNQSDLGEKLWNLKEN